MAKILVTGGAGYIGSVLVPTLVNIGHKVIVLDNFMYGQRSLLDCCHNPNLEIIRGDCRDAEKIRKILDREMDFVLPLACIVGAPACDRDPQLAGETNLDAIGLLLDMRTDESIIFPNTNSGYGIGQDGIFCTEQTPLNPISLYGKLKVEAENLVLASGNAISLRLATVFGVSPRMRLDLLVNDLTHKAVTDGYAILFEAHFKRNYVHARDVVRAFIHCINNFDRMSGEVYNVGLSDANLSKWELCEKIREQVPNFYFAEAPLREDPDKRNYIVSNTKIEATGFKPQVSLEQGIAELVKAYQVIRQREFSNI